jgi:integrating conjugative element relaxase (TIGR03760 family)
MTLALIFILFCMLGCGYCAHQLNLFDGHHLKGLLGWGLTLSGQALKGLSSPKDDTPKERARFKHESLQGSRPGWLKVLVPSELIDAVGAMPALHALARESRLDTAHWQRDLLCAIHRYAELVQLMPASEAHHHAHAGGLLAHTLEVLLAAMRHRNAVLLPQGASIEEIDPVRDHWTYVVFFAALLHDVGKPLTDLRITWSKHANGEAVGWSPLAGSLQECGAVEYHVAFTPKPMRNYAAHSRSAILMLKQVAPPSALSFLASHPPALDALSNYLSGERQGFVAELIKRADVQSAKHALLHGSRAQFPTAGTTPLVACLMDSLRQLLREGSELPLNRDGAAGWVFDDSVWFVAKRLVEQLRKHLAKVAPDLGVPSDPSRLFDVFQDYQEIVINASTGQAIWSVTVHGLDGGKDGKGYVHDFQVLRFKLDKLWPDASLRPAAMRGRVEVLANRTKPAATEEPPPAENVIEPEANTQAAADKKTRAPPSTDLQPVEATGEDCAAASQPALQQPSPKEATQPSTKPITQPSPTSSTIFEAISALGQSKQDNAFKRQPPLSASPAPQNTAGAVPSMPNPYVQNLSKPGSSQPGATSHLGMAFFEWLQAGLVNGEITINQAADPQSKTPASMVHVVHNGLGLVTPKIYEVFTKVWNREHGLMLSSDANDPAAAVTFRQVQQAAIAMKGFVHSRKSCIHAFDVLDKDHEAVGTLNMHIFEHPTQYLIQNLPPINKALRIKK